jgi:hypothetical protein
LGRGQAYYIEFVVVLCVFVVALGLFVQNVTNSMDSSGLSIISKEARIVSDQLMSAGIPADWNFTNMQRLGLTNGLSRINETKLMMFRNMSYSSIKNNLSINSDFYFYLEHKNETRIAIGGEQGIGAEPADAKKIVKNLRLVIYNSEAVRMVVLIWQKA